MNISASLEDYLSTIYLLISKNGIARLTDIANYMDVRKSSVNKAVQLLKDEKLVNYEKYGNIELTNTGEVVAKQIIKRSELFKKFLTDILEVDKKLAKKEANNLSHCVSCHTTAKLEKFIEDILKIKE